ncbi:MAG: hypothetical protein ACOCXZ_01135 [Chloroflexota bacterium]
MDRNRIINQLGLVPDGGLSVVDIQMVEWGRDLLLGCIYRTIPEDGPPDAPVHFNIIFKECREIRYRVYAHIGMHEHGSIPAEADVAELILGQANHRKDASVLTNLFGLTISYGSIQLEMNDTLVTLEK